jgi:ATP-dependent Zn protease
MTDLELTAYHEAAHVVVAHALNVPIRYVTIMHGGKGGQSSSRYVREADLSKAEIENEIRILGVSRHVEEMFGAGDFEGCGGDLDLQKYWALMLYSNRKGFGSPAELEAAEQAAKSIIEPLDRDALKILQRNWRAVEAVAHELIVKKTISGERSEEIIRSFKKELTQEEVPPIDR